MNLKLKRVNYAILAAMCFLLGLRAYADGRLAWAACFAASCILCAAFYVLTTRLARREEEARDGR